MRHHFGDALDRDGGYWTIVPNRERYAYRIGDVPEGSEEVTIVTIGKDDENWSRALTLPALEELTLHEPTPEQLLAVGNLQSIKRLRITHARPRTIDFINSMSGVEELVLEYVSGFSDLSPLRSLKRLRALHIENLRRVSDFSGLSGATNLEYLSIQGTLDWQQPIDDFEFLRGLPQLEVLALWQMICRAPDPAMLPLLSLRKLKKLRVHGSYLRTEDYALLEEGLKGVEGATWGPYRTRADNSLKLPNAIDDAASLWFEFTGRGAGRIKCTSPTAEARCREQSERYAAMKKHARALINRIESDSEEL